MWEGGMCGEVCMCWCVITCERERGKGDEYS